ncbi:MAG: metallophosphoesterase [Candidatus Caldarchaeum sp.]|nr:metallophosphoesterase [Candidatus Caldarchaeum sp.]
MLSRGRQLYRELVSIAVSEGFQLTEKALKKLEESENPVENLLRTIEELKKQAPEVPLIDVGHLKLQQTEEKPADLKLQLEAETTPLSIPKMTTVNLIEDDYRIEGEFFEFHRYFMDRYRKIRRILERRNRNYKPVAEAVAARDGEEVEIAVMVLGREERKNSLILDVEDPSGVVRVVVPVKNQQMYREACELVNDVVVGMKVRKSGDLLILREAAYPDVEERQQRSNQTNPEAYVCLISDVHVGSKNFRQDLFEKFLDWVNRGRDGVAKRITHIVIAGDLVEGVGVYPGQEKDLMIKNVEDQFKEASKLLAEIPERIEVVFSPGNHEPVRKALPQPPLQKRYRDLVNKRRLVSFVSNPANLVFDGVRILVYHGQGLDELIQSIPESSYSNLRETGPKLMSYMLKCRHLAPVYGENTQLLPMNEDRLVISETPNVFQTGHIHVVVKTNYKGAVLINSGAWQDQTEYQRSMGMEPMTGYAALYNLANHDVSFKQFGS